MKALYKFGTNANDVALRDCPIPEINSIDNVRIKVHYCAICGMDHQIMLGKFPCTPPFIMGHEFMGVVDQVAPGVTSLKPGDRVVGEPHLYACGHCTACRDGLPQLCVSRRSIGIQRDGAMTSYLVMPEKHIHKIPDSIPDQLACLMEPFSMIMGNIGVPVEEEQAENVVIMGAGLVGQFGLVAAKACGAKQVIVSDLNPSYRTELAQKLGADVLLFSETEDVVQRVMELTGGVGADMVLEATGAESAINSAFAMIKNGGLISVMGGTKRDSVSLHWDVLLKKAARVHFHMMSDYKYMDKAIEVFAKPYTDLSPLITAEFSLDEWEDAFKFVADRKSIKTIIRIKDGD